jgi:hypothetical protein
MSSLKKEIKVSKPSQSIYQFKITLEEVKPAIWRRIQVPSSYSFQDFHNVIQSAMGWQNYHLYAFEVLNPKTGMNQRFGNSGTGGSTGTSTKIEDFFSMKNKMAFYQYDFGDDWGHTIILEKILPMDYKKKYPICLDGKRACPPEDSGGPWGYEELLTILKNPRHSDYRNTKEWVGRKFDPKTFKVEDVFFSAPKEHADISED